MLTGLGFMTYYGIPLSFYSGNLSVTFLLLSLILQLIIIGLAFLCTLLFNYLERLLLWVTVRSCCRRDKRLEHVIVKNMEGH